MVWHTCPNIYLNAWSRLCLFILIFYIATNDFLIIYILGLQDYDSMPLTVFFEEGKTSATANVRIVNDTILEHLETFSGTLSLPEGTADFIKIGTSDSATINIIDNDAVEVNFNPTEYSVSEGGGSVELKLVASALASFDYSVTVETFDGTASK